MDKKSPDYTRKSNNSLLKERYKQEKMQLAKSWAKAQMLDRPNYLKMRSSHVGVKALSLSTIE